MIAPIVLAVLAGLTGAPGNSSPGPGFTLRNIPVTVDAPGSLDVAMGGETIDGGRGQVSVGRAVLYSLLLPGLGDYALGRRSRAVAFFGVEAGIWTFYAASRIRGNERETAYQDMAVRFAGIARTGHSDDFYIQLREFDSSVAYEKEIKNEGRFELFPDVGSESLDRYFIENRVADFEPWEWVSIERKVQYQEARSASKNAYRRSGYAIAAAAANRVVAAVFAFSAARSRDAADETSWFRRYQVDFTPLASDDHASVTLIRRF